MLDEDNRYAADHLDGRSKELYADLVAHLSKRVTKFTLRGKCKPEEIFRILLLVLDDYPEFYWVTSQVLVTPRLNGETLISFPYSSSPSRAVDEAAAKALDDLQTLLPSEANDYTKAKEAFALVTKLAEYDWEEARIGGLGNVDSHAMSGVFVYGKAVCDGYASALQFLLQQLGVPSFRVEGETGRSGETRGKHAWVIAQINGSWYHLDPTWADIASMADISFGDTEVNFDYFCLRDTDIACTHRAECSIEIPCCVSSADNYYRRENLSLQTYSDSMLVDIAARQIGRGFTFVSMRAASRKVYEKTMAVVQSGNVLVPLLERAWRMARRTDPPPQQYRYYKNDDLFTIHIALV